VTSWETSLGRWRRVMLKTRGLRRVGVGAARKACGTPMA